MIFSQQGRTLEKTREEIGSLLSAAHNDPENIIKLKVKIKKALEHEAGLKNAFDDHMFIDTQSAINLIIDAHENGTISISKMRHHMLETVKAIFGRR